MKRLLFVLGLGFIVATACSNNTPPEDPSTGGGHSAGSGGNSGLSGSTSTSTGGKSTSGTGGQDLGPPIVDEEGWTVFEPGEGTRIFYVSSSEGSDSNSGASEDEPLATISTALGRLRDGDWLLLKRGDTFSSGIRAWVNGLSAEHRSVIGAYGPLEDPRPIIDPGNSAGIVMQGGGERDTLEHVALVSLHIRRSRSIVGDPNYSMQSDSDGIRILRPGNDLLLEDAMIESFSTNFSIQGEGEGFSNLTIRRSVLVDAYTSPGGEHSQASYFSKVHNLVIEESVFDHNGYNEDVNNAYKTIYNHNIYIQGDCPNPTVRNNIIARGSSNGYQLRSAGTAEGNILIANGIAGFVANGVVSSGSVMVQRNNVVLHGSPDALGPSGESGTRGWGLSLVYDPKYPFPDDPIDFTGNIIAHAEAPARSAIDVPRDFDAAEVDEDNVVYKWGSANDEGGPFSDPDRTIPTYQESIGGEATIEAFLAAAREMRKGYWNLDYTAEKIRAYFAEGFLDD